MSGIVRFAFLVCLLSVISVRSGFAGSDNLVKNGGFEQGFPDPFSPWGNMGACWSTATLDLKTSHSGTASLHIVNTAARAPNDYGTMAQTIAIQPGQRYQITLWAKGQMLASRGAVNIAVDQAWKIRPLALPAGTFPWQKFTGTFTLAVSSAVIRIISEDKGEAWIDDISVVPLKDDLY